MNPITGGLYDCIVEVNGPEPLRQAFVAKVLTRPPHQRRAAPTFWMYWAREACFYQSGLARLRSPGLGLPQCLATLRVSATKWLLVLERLESPGGVTGGVTVQSAAALGAFAGFWTSRWPPRPPRWLSTHWLRDGVSSQEAQVLGLAEPSLWRRPELRRAFPEPVRVRWQRLFLRRDDLLAALERLPQTLCHFDPFGANLFPPERRGEPWRAIDWAFVGRGAVGVDLGQALAGNLMWLLDQHSAAATAKAIDDYSSAVRRYQPRCRRAEIEFAASASAALRAVGYLPHLVRQCLDRTAHAELSARWGGPVPSRLRAWGANMLALLELGEAALAQLDSGRLAPGR